MKDLLAPWFQAGISSRLTGPDRLQRLQRCGRSPPITTGTSAAPVTGLFSGLPRRCAAASTASGDGGRHRIDRDHAIGDGRRRNRTYRSNEDHGRKNTESACTAVALDMMNDLDPVMLRVDLHRRLIADGRANRLEDLIDPLRPCADADRQRTALAGRRPPLCSRSRQQASPPRHRADPPGEGDDPTSSAGTTGGASRGTGRIRPSSAISLSTCAMLSRIAISGFGIPVTSTVVGTSCAHPASGAKSANSAKQKTGCVALPFSNDSVLTLRAICANGEPQSLARIGAEPGAETQYSPLSIRVLPHRLRLILRLAATPRRTAGAHSEGYNRVGAKLNAQTGHESLP